MKTRRGCRNCQRRHLKCDNQRPTCSSCTRSGTKCIRTSNIRFRYQSNPSVEGSEFNFDTDQVWCKTSPKTLTFIDETKELASLYDDSVLEYEPAGPIAGASLPVHTAPSNLAISPLAAQASDGRDETTSGDTWSTVDTDSVREQLRSPRDVVPVLSPSYSSISYNPPLVVDSPIRPSSITHSIVSLPHQPRSHSTPTFPLTGNSPSVRAYNAATSPHDHPTPSLEPSSFPLSDVQEAKLVYHFVTKLACFFDMCDQDNRHFELVVPQRAAACPTLRNAIFAASAKHLSRTSGFDPVVADRYHQESLKYLIPALNDSTAVMNEDLLAATIILRFLEEVEGACLGEDVESHLLGTHAFIGAQNSSGINGGLREACFWVALRQENRMAFVHQRCVSSAFHHYNLDLSMSPASDSVWANRIVMHASNTLRYCFGDGDKNIATYHELVAYSEQWMECKPQSFTPLYYKEAEPDGDIFPSVWYLNDAVVNGMQYYYLIDIVLAAYNPEIPSLGPRRKPMLQHVNERIRDDVKMVCGIALAIKRNHASYVAASMAITVAADLFVSRAEQDALMRILKQTEVYAWSTSSSQDHLREAWGIT